MTMRVGIIITKIILSGYTKDNPWFWDYPLFHPISFIWANISLSLNLSCTIHITLTKPHPHNAKSKSYFISPFHTIAFVFLDKDMLMCQKCLFPSSSTPWEMNLKLPIATSGNEPWQGQGWIRDKVGPLINCSPNLQNTSEAETNIMLASDLQLCDGPITFFLLLLKSICKS